MFGFRIKTLLFYGTLTLLTLVAIIMVVSVNSKTKFTAALLPIQADLILDAGHGGLDGGAVSPDGVCEAPITLCISEKTQLLFGFIGRSALMTRIDDRSLNFRDNATLRENKNADLTARLEFARQYPGCAFLSIHLNQFPDSRYSGAQAFYNRTGEKLAQTLQAQLRAVLDEKNDRLCKPAPDSVFLMKNIVSPAVTIECGFLSNPEECTKLCQDVYQTKIAMAIVSGYELYHRG